MDKISRNVFLSFVFILTNHAALFAATKEEKKVAENFNWEPVIQAIIEVESGGNPRAKSGNSVGVLQITPILVAECNAILKRQKSKRRYTTADRWNVAKSKEMFLIIQAEHNPTNNIDRAIRSWNGGMRYRVAKTQRYFNKVMKALRAKQTAAT